MQVRTRFAAVIAVLVCSALGISRSFAQTPLASADVAKFMGAWELTLESPQGAFNMTLTMSDKAGKAAAELTSDMAPAQDVTDISKEGEDLVLKYEGNFQGQAFNAKINLTPDAEKLKVNFDIMNGQFMMSGTGVKK